jgi:uncharacterized delta-60 repeat protein
MRLAAFTFLLALTLVFIPALLRPQVPEDWVARFDGGVVPETNGRDELAVAVCGDVAGNVYVTGLDADDYAPKDWITVKFGPDGDTLWVALHAPGPTDVEDAPYAIAADNAGCAYVTGSGWSGSVNFATVKYRSDGSEAWAVQYDGSGKVDVATAIAVDELGNVYVTGRSENSDYDDDFVTIKYDSLGGEVWAARYAGAYGDDHPRALAVGDSGVVYVTGRGGDQQFVTVKYGPDGEERWVATRPGAYVAAEEGGWGVAVSDSGYVYVAGRARNPWPFNDYDYMTVKYDPAGGERWAAAYGGDGDADQYLCDLVVDESGNSYVTGWDTGVQTGKTITTVKYDAAGQEEWTALYTGPDGSYWLLGLRCHIALGPVDDLWVAGPIIADETTIDYVVVKYDTAGGEIWNASYDGPGNGWDEPVGVVPDGAGGVLVAGTSRGSPNEDDFAVVRYDATGTELWVARYLLGDEIPPRAEDIPHDIAVSADGDVYVTGESYWRGEHDNCVTVKYDAQGHEEWSHRYNDTDDWYDWGVAVTTDEAGYVYVAGVSYKEYDGYDFLTIKLTEEGEEEWLRIRNGPDDGSDYAEALTVDTAGNVYVVGKTQSLTLGDEDYGTLKYAPDGTEEWIVLWDGEDDADDVARAVAVDDLGNVYVTGGSENAEGKMDIVTIKYDTDGDLVWSDRRSGGGGGRAVVLDGAGNAYVAGTGLGASGTSDYLVVKYDAAGDTVWLREYDGPAGGDDNARAAALDGFGNLFVTGESEGIVSGFGYATLKYLPDGGLDWAVRYDSPYGPGWATGLAVDPLGNVYVTGRSCGETTVRDFVTIMYDSQGNQQWLARYDHPGGDSDRAWGIGLDAEANVYVTGYSWDPYYGADYATVRYPSSVETGASHEVEDSIAAGRLTLRAPRPNPTSGEVKLSFFVPPGGGRTRITIHDLSGRVVATVCNRSAAGGSGAVVWDGTDSTGHRVASGVYFVRLAHQSNIRIQKVVVLR